MKKIFGVLTMLMSMAFAVNAQTGTWSGSINVQGNALKLVFNFAADGCTLDVPDQGAKGIPATLEKHTANGIVITVPSIHVHIDGTLNGDQISGTFKQHGIACPLVLKPGVQLANRPQTPQAPFPYTTEEVQFMNGSAVLSGTLTLPVGVTEDTPVVIMVTGSGQHDRDETMFEHKPFAVIADHFARHGIATLRYDDRGCGKSTGDVANCTTEDLKEDALAGVRILRERFARVGVLGHSEGGTIGLMLAAEGAVDYVLCMAGMVISGKETLLAQNRATLFAMGQPEDIVERYCGALSQVFNQMMTEQPEISVEKFNLPEGLKQNLAMVAQQNTPYLRYFLRLNMSETLKKISCPVFALNGLSDTQVDPDKSLLLMGTGMKKGLATTKAYPDLNHLFQHCETGKMTEYKEIEETISTEVLADMNDWIKGM